MSGRRCSGSGCSSVGIAAVILAVSVLGACGGNNKASSPTTTTPARTAALDVYLVRNEKLMVAGRLVAGSATPERALRALVAGPQGSLERDLGMKTEIPTGTTINGVKTSGDTATVDLSKSFETGGGSQSMQARVAQVVFTVTQFSAVTRVRFEIDGKPVTSIGGEGVMVDGVGRSAFSNVTPNILVESPTPGATVRSPFHVRGIENTFEQTVNYTLTDPDGLILKEGFATGTGPGRGSWGPFAFDVSYTTTRAGMGELIVYQISAQGGPNTDVMEIPIRLER